MSSFFYKFPSTPHLANLPGVDIRGDKVLSKFERDEFLQHVLLVEEKVDGANLGISYDSEGNPRAQSRGRYLSIPGSGQWKKLDEWLKIRADALFTHLLDRYILFGEWCYAQHSIYYEHLPDWFLAFDILDRQNGRFLSANRRDDLVIKMNLAQVPVIARGHFTFPELINLLSTSKLTNQPAEGIYLRVDQGDWLNERAKLVRPTFITSKGPHWSRFAIKPNRLFVGTRHQFGRL